MEWRMRFCQNSTDQGRLIDGHGSGSLTPGLPKLHASPSPQCMVSQGLHPQNKHTISIPLPPFFIRLFMPGKVLLHIGKRQDSL